MNTIKRNIPLFVVLALLSVSPFTLTASAQGDMRRQDDQSADQPRDDSGPAYDQPRAGDQSQASDDDQYSNDDDQYGTNDEQEAQGQDAPPPPSNRPQMDRPRDSDDQSGVAERQYGGSEADQDQGGPAAQPGPGLNQPTLSENGNDANAPDAPSRAVRMQFMNGSVSIQPHGAGDWANGELNRPLTNGDNVWADKNSRAEMSVGTGLIRIDSESSLTLTNIDANSVHLQLHQGALIVHVRRLYDNEVWEVDTPDQAFTVSKPGDYRFDVDPNADTTVITVWGGEGNSAANGTSIALHANEQVRFTGNQISGQVHAAPSPDDFDRWASSRDQHMDHSQSARYVSPDVPGSEDLDEYGSWSESPDYGAVWQPRGLAVGWAPYRNGHWIWVSPWGWTWVEDEPWGYAPFHYGRWVYWGGAWGWAPGPIYARPYYAPALVAWFGGGGFGVGVGFGGGYGWCPLGFGEAFVPWYHGSRGYFNRVNITNTRITNVRITNVYNNTYLRNGRGFSGGGGYGARDNLRYANMHAPNGFTAVSRSTLVNSQQVARNNIRVSANELGRMTAVRSVDVRPSRTTVLGAGRPAAMPPSRSFSRPTVSRSTVTNGERGFSNAGGVARNNGGYSDSRGPSMSRPDSRPSYGARGSANVPRPPSANSRGYSGPGRSYGGGGGAYGRSSGPAYDRGGNGRAAPSYGGRPAPPSGGSRSGPAYGGGRPAPAYSGGGGGRAPSNSGGGGSHAGSGSSGGGERSGGGDSHGHH